MPHRVLVAVAVLLLSVELAGSPQVKTTDIAVLVYVGSAESPVRDGFKEAVPPGVLDSVKDLYNRLRRYKGIKLMNRAENADVVLRVVARRRTVSGTGAVAMPIGSAVVAVPLDLEVSTVETILQAGEYRKPIVGVDETWGAAADSVVKDVVAWVNTNHAALVAARVKN